jgi:hypothetical protein
LDTIANYFLWGPRLKTRFDNYCLKSIFWSLKTKKCF